MTTDDVTAPVVDSSSSSTGDLLSFFSVVSTIGTPIDVTAQEMRLEAFFPSDDETRSSWATKLPPDGHQ